MSDSESDNSSRSASPDLPIIPPCPEIVIPDEFKNAEKLTSDGFIRKISKTSGNSAEKILKLATAWVTYTGKLQDGTIIDDSKDEPIKVLVGMGQVIKGLDIVLETMCNEETCSVFIHPNYGYGELGSPPKVPPHSVLIFDLKVVKVEYTGEDITDEESKMIFKITLDNSKLDPDIANNHPIVETAPIVFDYKKNDEEKVENFELVIGEESLHPDQFVPGVRECLKSMLVQETAKFTLKPNCGYNPTKEEVVYVITVHSAVKTEPVYDMSSEEKYERAVEAKREGTFFLKEGKYAVAMNKFQHTLHCLEYLPADAQKDKHTISQWAEIKTATWLNCSLICLATGQNRRCLAYCNFVLKCQVMNEKAQFRRAEAFFRLKEYHNACAGFKCVLRINPENMAAKRGLLMSARGVQAWKEMEKQRYSKMFVEQPAKN